MVLPEFISTIGRVPLIIFNAEEINAIRGMLLRSDWRCEVTDRMREFVDRPEVIEYLENAK